MIIKKIHDYLSSSQTINYEINDVELLPPVPKPNSFRDAYAFKEHVETCRKNRGASMIREFYEFPVFYFLTTTLYLDIIKVLN